MKQVGDEVVFAAKFEAAKKVLIAGDFNGWQPMSTPMSIEGTGRWKTKLPLPPGRYRYRLVVDGLWMTDPNNKYVETNQFGELNNVVEVDLGTVISSVLARDLGTKAAPLPDGDPSRSTAQDDVLRNHESTDPQNPKRSLSEISHLFLSSVRDRQTGGARARAKTADDAELTSASI